MWVDCIACSFFNPPIPCPNFPHPPNHPPTLPKTQCRPSRWAHSLVVMKNWEPLVLGPAFAELNKPASVCLILKFSSLNLAP